MEAVVRSSCIHFPSSDVGFWKHFTDCSDHQKDSENLLFMCANHPGLANYNLNNGKDTLTLDVNRIRIMAFQHASLLCGGQGLLGGTPNWGEAA